MPKFGLKNKVKRRRIETLLLAGYAFAVTCALFVSLSNKNVSDNDEKVDNDNFSEISDVLTPAFNDSVEDNPFEKVYLQVNNIKLLSDDKTILSKFVVSHDGKKQIVMPVSAKPTYEEEVGSFDGIYQKERRVIVVSAGDSFIGILANLGMEERNATAAYNALRKVYDAQNLQPGQHIELTATFDVKTKELETLDTLVIEPVRGTKYILQINEYDKFEARVEQEKFDSEIKVVSGTISGIVSTSLNSAGVPKKLCGKMTQLFSQLIDFRRDVKKGDKFTIKYEVNKDSEGEIVNIGDIVYASFTLGKQEYKLYRFKNRNGDVDYYDEKGGAKKTGLDRKPLAMRNARISSLYGYRRHPIYKTTKFHSGVDYAAPRGVAVFASGSGVLELVRYVNGYGNSIKIRHNSEYQTFYAHMHKFAAGMKPGVRVKKGQIIGYVGSTGRSTGPHLHFEILRKGQRIDPLKAKVATGDDLSGGQLAEFKRMVKKIDSISSSVVKIEDNSDKKVVLNEINDKTTEASVEKKAEITSEITEENVAEVVNEKQDKGEGLSLASENAKAEEKVDGIIYPIEFSADEARSKYGLKIKMIIPTRKPEKLRKSAEK